MFKKIGLMVVGMAFVASPLIASADVLSDLQAQLQSLLSQLHVLQQAGNSNSFPDSAVCTMEAKQCPDGSYVGRSGPNCEFATCGGGASPSRVCPQILRYLSQGSTGDDVMNLQTYLGVSATGYFGPLTANAVAKFQASEGLSQVGIVGPLTRAAFARRCGYPNPQGSSLSATPTRGDAPLPVNFTFAPKTDNVGQYYIEFGDGEAQVMDTQQIYCITTPCISPSVASHTYASPGSYTAAVSYYIACLYSEPRCLMAQPAPLATVTITVGNGSTIGTPSISGVDGPTTLRVGQQGTWSVRVADSSGYLSYSVRWGDEFRPFDGTSAMMAPWIGNSGTFTHTYNTAGTYSPTFTVTNGQGQSASASVTVVVGGGSTNSGTLSASPTSGHSPLRVHFATSNMTMSPSSIHDWYSVDFGDGTSAELALSGCSGSIGCVDHTYQRSGAYTARVVHHPDSVANCPTGSGTYCGSTLTFNTVTITVNGSTSGTPSISVSESPSSVVQGSAPVKTDGSTLSISWNSQNAPAGSAVGLWLMKSDGTNLGLIAGHQSVNGNYNWPVPGMQCDSSGSCSVLADSPNVYFTNPGSYYIVAKLYTPAKAFLGGYPPPNPTYPTNLSTSNSATFTITAH